MTAWMLKGTGDGGEITLDDNVKRILLPELLDGYLVSLGDGWKEAFLQELASLPEVIEGHVRRLIVLEDSLLNDQMNLEEQATHWLNWTPSIPVYPGTNQFNHYHLEGVDTPQQFFGFGHKVLRAVDLSVWAQAFSWQLLSLGGTPWCELCHGVIDDWSCHSLTSWTILMLPLLGSFFCHVWALALCDFLFTAVHSKGVACTMNEMYLEVVQGSWLPSLSVVVLDVYAFLRFMLWRHIVNSCSSALPFWAPMCSRLVNGYAVC